MITRESVIHMGLKMLGESPRPWDSLPVEEGIAALPPEEYLVEQFPAVAREYLLRTDPLSLDFCLRIPGECVAIDNRSGYLDLPTDFLTLSAFRMPDWSVTLHSPSPATSLRALPGVDSFHRTATPELPLLMIEGDFPGRRLRFVGTSVPNERPAVATYIPEPRWLPDGTMRISPSLLHPVLSEICGNLIGK